MDAERLSSAFAAWDWATSGPSAHHIEDLYAWALEYGQNCLRKSGV